jgi:uncharacterized repeat protein (TIGR01451 family)
VFTLVVRVAPAAVAASTISNSATVGSSTPDPTSGNETATAITTVAATADLSLTKVGSPNPVAAGSHLTYTVTVDNAGPSNAATVALTDPLPAGTTFVSLAAPAGWICTTPPVSSTGTVSCTNASLPPGPSVLTLVVAVDVTVPTGSTLDNSATVTAATTDPTPLNGTATASVTVQGAPVAAIPTIDEWGALLLALLLAAAGVWQWRRGSGFTPPPTPR